MCSAISNVAVLRLEYKSSLLVVTHWSDANSD